VDNQVYFNDEAPDPQRLLVSDTSEERQSIKAIEQSDLHKGVQRSAVSVEEKPNCLTNSCEGRVSAQYSQ
jgi:hypothetical protein